MHDIFLVHDLDLYEVVVRGDLGADDDNTGGASIARTCAMLPPAAAVVIDLRDVTALSRANACALADAVRALLARESPVACAVFSTAVEAQLAEGGMPSAVPVMADADDARRRARGFTAAVG